MIQHSKVHYRATVKTDDLAVLHCLRSISQYAQKNGNKRIPWGGTKKTDWQDAAHRVTFRFTSSDYRRDFFAQLDRLLPNDTPPE